ncbi:MAG: SUMF1/EgtB/PvdO family nonheme iron enzyme, partial [Gammaproteobacteria bacterium]|nr:SUMF1/EgtB/PvdO family nonheme iron enzyme [Gammaproteobacteria bacterium]
GNVWEWCATKWQGEYPLPNPNEWSDTYLSGDARRVLRGGSWGYGARVVRAACRSRDVPGIRFGILGFRCARVHS